MSKTPQPTWDVWGAELRRLREEADKTQAQLGRAAQVARSTLSAMERGDRVPRKRQAQALDQALATDGILTRMWEDASIRRDLPDWWSNALALELKSDEIWEFEPHVIPGLLQTPEYARQMIASGMPRTTDGEIDELVEKRVRRLEALRNRPSGLPVIRFIVGERTLTPPALYERLMPTQLEYLRQVIEEDNLIELRVIPTESIPLSIYLPFRLCSIEDNWVTHLEYMQGGATRDDPELISRLVTIFQMLAMESLPRQETLRRLKEATKSWNGGSRLTVPAQETASKSPNQRR